MKGYKKLKKLGEGGMGEVWLVMDETTRGLFAEKTLRPGLARSKDVSRFKREIDALKNLHHNNIVRIVDADVTDSTFSYVMEYCPDGNLLDHIARNQHAAILSYVRQIAEALAHLHSHALVHRDVKPQNILIGVDGQARLTDFGLVVESDPARPILTTSNWVSRGFSPPEQYRDMASVTPRGDLYALCALWFFLITGRTFDFDAPAEGQLAVLNPFEQHLLRRGLARDPGDRYATAGEIVQALDEAMEEGLPGFFAQAKSDRLVAIQGRFDACHGKSEWIDGWDMMEIPSAIAFLAAVLKYEDDEEARNLARKLKAELEMEARRITIEMEQDNP